MNHPPCKGVEVDVTVPMPDPIEGAHTMAARYLPACPTCKAPMQYVGFDFADPEDRP